MEIKKILGDKILIEYIDTDENYRINKGKIIGISKYSFPIVRAKVLMVGSYVTEVKKDDIIFVHKYSGKAINPELTLAIIREADVVAVEVKI